MYAECAGKTVRSLENACHRPYLSALEWSPQGAIQMHVYLTLPYLYLNIKKLEKKPKTILKPRSFQTYVRGGICWKMQQCTSVQFVNVERRTLLLLAFLRTPYYISHLVKDSDDDGSALQADANRWSQPARLILLLLIVSRGHGEGPHAISAKTRTNTTRR